MILGVQKAALQIKGPVTITVVVIIIIVLLPKSHRQWEDVVFSFKPVGFGSE